jgi:hypothetical protein
VLGVVVVVGGLEIGRRRMLHLLHRAQRGSGGERRHVTLVGDEQIRRVRVDCRGGSGSGGV